NSACSLDVVSQTQTRFRSGLRRQTGVMIQAKFYVDGQVAEADGILPVESNLIDVGRRVKSEQSATAGEVIRKQGRREWRSADIGVIDGVWLVTPLGVLVGVG